ncbi:IucA/IucC family protein [Streptosporangium jomthongense]|uniref:IucA/IucC family protein n=1 Tax=Streptosporangium jomthongense TaxID=1193683 RepID=A0ABV8FBL3_9ACTN
MGDRVTARERYLAARVLDALLREDYGGLAGRITGNRGGVTLALAGGRGVRLVPGSLFQDFVVAPEETLGLREVLLTLGEVAPPEDGPGIEAFAQECEQALRALELHAAHRERVLGLLAAAGPGERLDAVRYETLAAFVDHPVYPTARCRNGLSDDELTAYAPEFAPSFELRWAAVPRERARGAAMPYAPGFAEVGLPSSLARTHVLFPVHPLTVPVVEEIPWAVVGARPCLEVRPTLSTRTVALDAGTHVKLPLPTSTLGLRNRRSIKPGTLADGARAELLLRRLPHPGVLLADEQTYGHADHEYLGWLLRRLPPGEIVPVAALPAPTPGARPSWRSWPDGGTAGTSRRCSAPTSGCCSASRCGSSSGTAPPWRPTSRTWPWCWGTVRPGCSSRTTTGC